MLKNAKSIYLIELLLLSFLVIGVGFSNNTQRELFCIVSIGITLFISLLVYGNKKVNNAMIVSATRILVSVLLAPPAANAE